MIVNLSINDVTQIMPNPSPPVYKNFSPQAAAANAAAAANKQTSTSINLPGLINMDFFSPRAFGPSSESNNKLSRNVLKFPPSLRNNNNGKLSSSAFTVSSESTIDEKSPHAENIFSARKDENFMALHHLQMTLTEIVDTERQFIENTRELRNMYLENLQNLNVELPIPVRITKLCLEKMIEIHSGILTKLETIRLNRSLNYGEQANRISQVISQAGICCFWYSWYCSQHKAVGKMYNKALFPLEFSKHCETTNYYIGGGGEQYQQSSPSPSQLSVQSQRQQKYATIKTYQSFSAIRHLFTGVQNLVESQQPQHARKDLSIRSLSQQPIDRIVKYPLFVDSLCVNCGLLNYNTDLLNTSVDKIRRQLFSVNEATKQIEQLNELRISRLNQLIDWTQVFNNKNSRFNCSDFCNIDVDCYFFGNPLLIGFASVIYVNNNCPKLQHCPVILFKSHLVILQHNNIFKRTFKSSANNFNRKYIPNFIIPLVNTSLFVDEKNCRGLYLNYLNCLKLVFRVENFQFEVVLLFLDQKEFDIWKEHLHVSLNEVNGGSCDFKTTNNHAIAYLNYVPQGASIYATNFESGRSSSSSSSDRNLYKQEVFFVKFQLDLLLHNMISLHYDILEYASCKILTLKFYDVWYNERNFRDLILEKLPLYTINEY
ncbi:hypothetical protein KGF56_003735 [Candida oxycetoniae]|uniref:DH domain-containing protein n=1 Tax=Candida oxycetoniae TaxID=497107 RepID=A0AAI9SV52_9ASCO|nr:uncharacterized protein KGF56_003735 [Candida oxycetoniae]KAI3403451.2 hypothetical protein KGF56_003735 [Candida oxycetoniae]